MQYAQVDLSAQLAVLIHLIAPFRFLVRPQLLTRS
jgi:hypothetical protein